MGVATVLPVICTVLPMIVTRLGAVWPATVTRRMSLRSSVALVPEERSIVPPTSNTIVRPAAGTFLEERP